MTCDDVQRLLHPYSDGELDLVRHVEIERHLAGCDACGEQERRLGSLRSALASPALYHRAPASLRSRVQYAVPSAEGRLRRVPQLAALAAGVLLLVGAISVGAIISRAGLSGDDRLAQWVVAGHVRSLQAEHLMDVASTDRHTVKPWFRGKLDFSPVVPDLAPQGYPLTGGRLDFLVDKPAATLVYHRRLHVINVFTWPGDGGEQAVQGLSRQGFHLRHWQRAGMAYWAISDLNDQELDEFVRLFQEQTADPHP